jgi:chloride channel protein, CIC family
MAYNDLGDFTTTPRLLTVSSLAIGIGVLSAFVALGLLKLIGFFTNFFFYQRFATELVSPSGQDLL